MPSVKPKTKKTIKSEKAPIVAKKPDTGLELSVYNQEGQEVEKIILPESIFGLKINQDLIRQSYEAQLSQSRVPYAHTKDRSEVRGGGKKPWRQKGTGRARHGSIRSPLWRGGGVTFGPRKDKIFAKNINKKMRRKALLMVLSGKVRDNEMIILDNLKIEQPKTKLMADILKKFHPKSDHTKDEKPKVEIDLGRGALIAMAAKDENIIRASRNIPKILTIGAANLNVVDLLNYKYLVLPKESVGVIEKTFKK